ncbi:vasotab-like [Lycorma delicatula]|uniref:vasotab-like n=1 Tax=Lycorma delicatula TaxID=130591 RepID=UPI003F51AB42
MDNKLLSLTVLLVMSLFFLSPAESQECPTICLAVFDPVCAENSSGNQKTFGNTCNLEVFNCQNNQDYRVIRNGEC